MNAVALLKQRRQVSGEFLATQKQHRIVRALAEGIVDRGYEATTVAHVVADAGIARNTFYDNFGSKAQAAAALVAGVLPETSERMPLLPGVTSSLDAFAIELAAYRLTEQSDAGEALAVLDDLSRLLADRTPPSTDESLLCSLPPGRHGLNREFVRANQRQRLLAGFALAVTERGYPAVTIANIGRGAQVSRRTFYEHFSGCWEVAQALLADITSLGVLDGLGGVAVEATAAWFAGMSDRSELILRLAREVAGEALREPDQLHEAA